MTEATDAGGRPESGGATGPWATEAVHRWLFEAAADAILIADDAGRYLDANPQAEVLTGYSRAELLRLRVTDLTPEAVPDRGEPLYQEFVRRGRMTGEYSLRRKDGELVQVEYAAVRTGPGRSLSILRDVTARREAEAEREALLAREQAARAAAEAAVRARDEFLTVAAHELKTPLTALRGSVQIARRRLDAELAPAVGEDPSAAAAADVRLWLTRADQHAARLSRLIERLLEVARLESGRLVIDRRELDLVALVQAVVDGARERLPRGAVHLRTPPVPVRVAGDGLRLEQVIEHLLENAARYGAPSAAAPIEVAVWEDPAASLPSGAVPLPGRVQVSVGDRGPGIPPDIRERLFGRFAQGEHTATQSGLGLGLYLSRQIVEAHGGTLGAEFSTEKGARFVVTLPAA
jgi:PAS domain S-box-containing protein